MSTFPLNCLLLNDDPKRQFFTVKIPEFENVSILKKMIKEEKARHLGHLDASDLILWKLDTPIPLSHRTGPEVAQDVRAVQVHLPVEADEGNDYVQPLDAVEDVSDYWEDSPQPKHLHILVQKPSADVVALDPTQLLSVNCVCFKDDSTKVFTVKISESENVSILKELIKAKKARHLGHLDASDLILWKVSLSTADVDSRLKEANTGSKGNFAETHPHLLPMEKLTDVFPEPLQGDRVHILVELDSEGSTSIDLTRSRVLEPRQVTKARELFCKSRVPVAPSTGAKPREFRRGQENAPINCNRPQDTVKTLPLRLSNPIFGKFHDDCETSKPTPQDKTFIYRFVEAMSQLYDAEKDRQTVVLDLFRTVGIAMQPSKIIGTEYTTDGSIFRQGSFLYVLAELKNEISSTNCEPYLQAALYYLEATRRSAPDYRNSGLPCIILLIFGPFIAFAGATWTGKPNVQMLSTAFPCHYHDSDIKMRDSLLRHIVAFRNASISLEQYYAELELSGPSGPLCNPTYPYPTSFTSDSTTQTFRYVRELESEYNFVFFGDLDNDTADRRALCIKFTHQYGEDVHKFCADKGCAPRLRAVQRLPGGFYMVVMDDIGKHYIDLHSLVDDHPEILSSSGYTDLKKNIQRFLEDLHQNGWVHGDLRSTNVMVRRSGLDGSFLLVDFDWSGKNQEVVYPSFMNRTDVRRPVGVDDGEHILALHDVEMLSYF